MTRIQKIFPSGLVSKSRQHTDIILSDYARAKSVETIKIKPNSNKKKSVIVKTFFDQNNNILKRIITKKSKNNLEETIFRYYGKIEYKRSSLIEKFINKKKVQTIITTETLNKENSKPFLTRIKLIITPNKNKTRNETQIIEELSVKKHRKYIKTTATRNDKGELSNKTIESNIKNIREVKKSPYLYFINYPFKDFIISIFPYAKKLQKIPKRDIIIKFNKLPKEVAATSTSEQNGTGIVTFDLAKVHSKYYLVGNINHELRHQYQEMIIEKYSEPGLKGLWSKIKYPFKQSFVKRCRENFLNYISSSVDKEKYHNQYIETDANLATRNATQEYFNFTYYLNKIFSKGKYLFSKDNDPQKYL